MTLNDIAKIAGVSVSTVSKAFCGSREISNETKNLIFETAKKCGCFEKYYKTIYNKKVIAVICPEIQSEFYCTIVSQIEKSIVNRNGTMLLSLSHFNTELTKELFEYYSVYHKADGIIFIENASCIKNLEHIPAIALNSSEKPNEIDSIKINEKSAIYDAVQYFSQNGHREIGFIGELLTLEKQRAFIDSMRRIGLHVNNDYIITVDQRFEDGGYAAMEKLFLNKTMPTALLFAYDYMAFGAIKCIREHGLSVPEDISLIGMNDISAASHPDTPLTTISVRIDDICDIALDLLFRKMESKFYKSKQEISVSGYLVKRNSVKDISSHT